MGTYNKGILGPFTGKVGTVVGTTWRGKDVLRSLPKKTKRTPSETQQLQRERFLTATEFLTPINPVLGKYFGSKTGEKTRLNQAMSYHMKEAVVFQDPDFVIDYTKVIISKGDLPGLQNPTMTAVGGDKLSFTWEDNSGQGEAKATDGVIVVIYAPASGLYYTQLETVTRSALALGITLPTFFEGLEVQSWIGVTSADHKSNATSSPLAPVTVIA